MTVNRREEGILKRERGTPLPPWLYIAGRLASTTWMAFLAVALMMGVGIVFYGIRPGSGHAGGGGVDFLGRRRMFRRFGNVARRSRRVFQRGGVGGKRNVVPFGVQLRALYSAVRQHPSLVDGGRRYFPIEALCRGVFGRVQPGFVRRRFPEDR